MNPRCGFAAIYTVIALVGLCGLVSLGVDIGRVQLAKSELQTAADAAARAAASELASGVGEARSRAIAIAGGNTCDGNPVELDPVEDISFGAWDPATRTFTAFAGADVASASAIRVTAGRLAARNNAIPLTFARLVGQNTCDVRASSIVTVSFGGGVGLVGLDRITMRNNTVTSYRSSLGAPGGANLYNRGSIASNGPITLENSALVRGNVVLGPEGSFNARNSAAITGWQKRLDADLVYPPADAGSAATVNDNSRIPRTTQNRTALSGTAFSLNNNDLIAIPGGTYYFSSITLGNNSRVTFTGPATVYVNGNVQFNSNSAMVASEERPGDLRMEVLGSRQISLTGQGIFIADLYAPQSSFTLSNSSEFRGGAITRSIDVGNLSSLYYDENLDATRQGSGSPVISLVR
jgi:Flp pilus assembly protein TadG